MDCNLCSLCNKKTETVQHYQLIVRFQVKCDNWVEISLVRSNDIDRHFSSVTINSLSIKVWKGIWLTLAKEIWTHINSIVFNSGQVDEVKIFALVQLHAWNWAKFSGFRVQGSLSEWFMSPINFLKQVQQNIDLFKTLVRLCDWIIDGYLNVNRAVCRLVCSFVQDNWIQAQDLSTDVGLFGSVLFGPNDPLHHSSLKSKRIHIIWEKH